MVTAVSRGRTGPAASFLPLTVSLNISSILSLVLFVYQLVANVVFVPRHVSMHAFN